MHTRTHWHLTHNTRHVHMTHNTHTYRLGCRSLCFLVHALLCVPTHTESKAHVTVRASSCVHVHKEQGKERGRGGGAKGEGKEGGREGEREGGR